MNDKKMTLKETIKITDKAIINKYDMSYEDVFKLYLCWKEEFIISNKELKKDCFEYVMKRLLESNFQIKMSKLIDKYFINLDEKIKTNKGIKIENEVRK